MNIASNKTNFLKKLLFLSSIYFDQSYSFDFFKKCLSCQTATEALEHNQQVQEKIEIEKHVDLKDVWEILQNQKTFPNELNQLISQYYSNYEIIDIVNLNQFGINKIRDIDMWFLDNENIEFERHGVYNLTVKKFTNKEYPKVYGLAYWHGYSYDLNECIIEPIQTIAEQDKYKVYWLNYQQYEAWYSRIKKNVKIVQNSFIQNSNKYRCKIVFDIYSDLFEGEYVDFAISPNLKYFAMFTRKDDKNDLVIWRLK